MSLQNLLKGWEPTNWMSNQTTHKNTLTGEPALIEVDIGRDIGQLGNLENKGQRKKKKKKKEQRKQGQEKKSTTVQEFQHNRETNRGRNPPNQI
jgi:hypothetical protein